MSDVFVGRLAEIVGPRDVIVAPDVRASYETDWTRRWSGGSIAVVRPADAAQASAVLRICADEGVSVVPQGGNTGLVGGATPRGAAQQIVLSSARLKSIGEVDAVSGQVTVGAGVTLAELQTVARVSGFDAGLDLGARDTATVGGLAACDAGGLQAIRHGTARRRIAGLEAVLADGTIITRLSGLLRDNAGYDLPALLVGSEGTLGFITRVRWSCVAHNSAKVVALIALDSLEDAVAFAAALRWRLPSLEMLEFITDAGIRLLRDRLAFPLPIPVSPAWVLLECADTIDPSERLLAAIADLEVDERSAFAVDEKDRQSLLRLREALPELINQEANVHKLDVGLPLHALASFCDDLSRLVQHLPGDSSVVAFGHLGDGNVHVNVLGADPGGDVEYAILELVVGHGGTISAEHGIGVQKAGFLSMVRSGDDIRAMGLIKRALDPQFILNPNVVLEST